jgi:hypothetical protein
MTMAVVATTNKRTLAVMAATDDNQLKLSSPEKTRWSDMDTPRTESSSEKTRKSPTLVMAVLGEEEEEEQQQQQQQQQPKQEEQNKFMLETQAAPAVRLNIKSTVEERFADAQASARRLGNNPSLKWIYDVSDELHSATCGDVAFSREELLQLSRSSCWAGR